MAALAPLLCFGLLVLLWQRHSWRRAWLAAALSWGALLTAITEALSLFNLLTPAAVFGAWLASAVICGAVLLYRRRTSAWPAAGWQPPRPPWRSFTTWLLLGAGIILLLVGLTAWVAPPNSYDSMTYHMSRVVHWIQNRSVADYPTAILRQLVLTPWAEFALLNLQILAGSDRLANLVQAFSLLSAAIAVSLIAGELGAGRRGQAFASAACLAIPMAVLQGSSTQTDLVLAFWMACLAFYTLRFVQGQANLATALALGAALGLALLTKATAYIFAAPFLAWTGLACLRMRDRRPWLLLGLSLALALALNLGYYGRNLSRFGHIFGAPEETAGTVNAIFTPPALASNLVRNLAIHAGTPFRAANARIEAGIYRLHGWLGISPSDPRTTWGEFHVQRLSNHEDYAGNPLPLLYTGLCLAAFGLRRGRRRLEGFYLLACLAGFVLFSAYLKWQPWHSRLQLPLFVLLAAFIGLEMGFLRRRWLANLLMAGLLLAVVPWALRNDLRPLTGKQNIFNTSRAQQIFASQPSLADPTMGAARALLDTGCTQVGLVLGGDDWEYPFWALTAAPGREPLRFEHVNVKNGSRSLIPSPAYRLEDPCALLVVAASPPVSVTLGQRSYQPAWWSAPVGLYRPGR